VIVNPSYMLGPRDARPSSGRLIIDVVRGRVPGWTLGYNNFGDVRNVACGMIAAWHKGRRGERYILAGHDMTYGDVMRRIAEVAGTRPPRLRVPRAAAWLFDKWGDLVERSGREPVVNSTQVRYAYSDRFRFRSDKAARELGYQVSPVKPALGDAIAWFHAHGLLWPGASPCTISRSHRGTFRRCLSTPSLAVIGSAGSDSRGFARPRTSSSTSSR
jgi:dihydroflavonol-4-reductase